MYPTHQHTAVPLPLPCTVHMHACNAYTRLTHETGCIRSGMFGPPAGGHTLEPERRSLWHSIIHNNI
jgi:hypothetical protein